MEIGEKPAACLLNQKGEKIDISEYKGKWVVMYFYPKDNTPGCTQEAVEFSAAKDEFEKNSAVIVGVSGDSIVSHKKFVEKNNLRIELLSDEEHKVLEQFGVWGEKTMMGKKHMGIIRTTFLIDSAGEIKYKWIKVKVKGHVEEVLNKLKELRTAKP